MKATPKYQKIKGAPPWFNHALKDIGLTEIPGPECDARIGAMENIKGVPVWTK